MQDFQAIPLISDHQAIRTQPLASPAQQATGSGTPGSSGSGARASVTPASSSDPNSVAAAVTQDGELDEGDIQALQEAASQGDPESMDYLKQLGLPLGIAGAAVGGAYLAGKGGMALFDSAMSRSDPASMPFADQARSPNGAQPTPRDRFVRGGNQLPSPRPQLALPAPTPQITDQTGSRFQQPAPAQQGLIPDLNKTGRETDAAYAQKAAQDAAREQEIKLRGNLGQSVGMRLKAAASAARRVR